MSKLNSLSKSFRPTLENLEAREVFAAGIAAPMAALPAAVVAPAVTKAAPMVLSAPAAQVDQVKAAASVNSLVGVQSKITIRNPTGATVAFTIQWAGYKVSQTYYLGANQSRWFTAPGVGAWGASARTATIRFDSRFATGWQTKAYTLTSRTVVEGSSNAGQAYNFYLVSGGVDLRYA